MAEKKGKAKVKSKVKAPSQRSKKRKTTDSWKKKEWYTVVAPKEFESKEIGNTVCLKPETLLGRILKVSLRDLTGNIRDQQTIMHFKIKEVKGKTAYTETAGFEVSRDHFRRNVRRGRSMVTAVHDFVTKEGIKAQVTANLFTGGRINTEKKNLIRGVMVSVISESAVSPAHEITKKALHGEFAVEMKKRSKSICPVKFAMVNKLELKVV